MNEIEFPREFTEVERYKTFTTMTIKSEADAGFVVDKRKEVKDQINGIEKTRKSFTEPLLESKKRIDQQAKNLSLPLEAVLGVLNHKLLEWNDSQEQIRIEAAKKKREAELVALAEEKKRQQEAAFISDSQDAADAVVQIETNMERLETKPIEISTNTRTTWANAYVSTYWVYEIIDANLVPDNFWILDESAIRKYMMALKEKAVLPGVKFTQKKRMGG